MPTVNDTKFDALRTLGYTGSIGDMELVYLQALGATANTVQDAWKQIIDATFPVELPALNEGMFAYFKLQGAVGESFNDVAISFWGIVGGSPPPTSNVTWHYPFLNDALDTKSLNTAVHIHGSPQYSIREGLLVNNAIDVPAIGLYGIEPRPQDTSAHWWHYDVTQNDAAPNPKGWSNDIGLTKQVVADTAPDLTGSIGVLGEIAVVGFKQIDMSYSTNDILGGRIRGGLFVKPLGDSRYIKLTGEPSSFVVFDIFTGNLVTSESSDYGDSGILLLDSGWCYCYFDTGTVGIGSDPAHATINLLDNLYNESYLGVAGNGIGVYGAHYTATGTSRYAPVLSPSNSSVTRLNVADVYAPVTTPTDRNYTIYFEAINTAGLLPVADISGDAISVFSTYTNGDFDTATEGFAFGLLANLVGDFGMFASSIESCNEQCYVSLSDWPLGEMKRCMLEVRDGLPLRLTVDAQTGVIFGVPLSIYPILPDSFYLWANNASITEDDIFFGIRNLKRIETIGLTLTGAQNAQ